MELKTLSYPLQTSSVFDAEIWHNIKIIKNNLPKTNHCYRLTNGLLFHNFDLPSKPLSENETVNLINAHIIRGGNGSLGWILYREDIPDPYFPWNEEFNDEWMQELKKCFDGIE